MIIFEIHKGARSAYQLLIALVRGFHFQAPACPSPILGCNNLTSQCWVFSLKQPVLEAKLARHGLIRQPPRFTKQDGLLNFSSSYSQVLGKTDSISITIYNKHGFSFYYSMYVKPIYISIQRYIICVLLCIFIASIQKVYQVPYITYYAYNLIINLDISSSLFL